MENLTPQERLSVLVSFQRLLYQVSCLKRANDDFKLFPHSQNYKRRRNKVYGNLMEQSEDAAKLLKKLGLSK